MKDSELVIFAILAHNGKLVKKAEKILQEFVDDENCKLYLQQPDGTTVKFQKGFKLINIEIMPINKEE